MEEPTISGLTLKEVRKLQPCIAALQELEHGTRKPKTAMQKHFVSACRGEAPPRTVYEKAYIRWRDTKPNLEQLATKLERIHADGGTSEGGGADRPSLNDYPNPSRVEDKPDKTRGTDKQKRSRFSRRKDTPTARQEPTASNPNVTSPMDVGLLQPSKPIRPGAYAPRPFTDEELEAMERKGNGKKRYIKEWGTRDDWRKDRYSWKRNSR